MRAPIRRLALALLTFLLGTVAAGGILALALVVLPAPQPATTSELAWLEESWTLGWRVRPGFRGEIYGALREFDAHGHLVVDRDDFAPTLERGERRVLVLGDSRSFGNGVPVAETYAERLETLLPATHVVNLSVPGYSSEQGITLLSRELPRLRPDVVVFAFDFNDRRYVLDAGSADSAVRFTRLALASRTLGAARLVGFGSLVGRELATEAGLAGSLDLATVRPRVSPERLVRNLMRAASLCGEHRARLLVLLLADNPRVAGELEGGLAALAADDFARAQPLLQAAIEQESAFSDAARLALGDALARRGDLIAAQRVRQTMHGLSSVMGGRPILPGSLYRASALATARRAELTTVDAAPDLAEHPEWFFDYCHFGVDGHRMIATRLAAAIRTPPSGAER